MKILRNPVVLIVLGLMLAVGTSAAILWTGARPLFRAAAASKHKEKKVEKPEEPWDFWTIEIESLANELKDQKVALRQREESVAVREARLVSEQQEMLKTRQQLESLRSEISSKMIEVQADEMKNLKTLANTYSNLTPRAAVSILREMDEVTVVKVLSLMKADQVSALFEEMGKSPDPLTVRRAGVLAERIRLLKSARTAAATP